MNNSTDKKFNLNVAPFWETQSGNFMSIEVTDDIFSALQQIEKGGKLFLKRLPDTARKKETSPVAMLEYISRQDVKSFKERQSQFKDKTADSVSVTPPTDAL